MTVAGKRAVHYAIRAVILFGFAFYILQLAKNGHILFYIAPRMILYVKLSAIGLYVTSAYQAYLAARSFRNAPAGDCGCEHLPDTRTKSLLLYTLFSFPLLLAFLLPDSAMGSALAAKKGVNLSAAGEVGSVPPLQKPPAPASTKTLTDAQVKELFPADEYTAPYAEYGRALFRRNLISVKDDLYMETLTTVDMFADRFAGKPMEISGFVYREENMKENQFVVARFAMSCCSADATPYGVLVVYDRAKLLVSDTWLKLTGTIGRTMYNGSEILFLKADKVEKIPTPPTNYVYPNPDFGAF